MCTDYFERQLSERLIEILVPTMANLIARRDGMIVNYGAHYYVLSIYRK